MAQVMSELLARFEVAREKLTRALEQAEGDNVVTIVAADRELSDVFSQILEADLVSNEDRAARIEFMLNEIMAASDRDGLVCSMAKKALGDVQTALAQYEADGAERMARSQAKAG